MFWDSSALVPILVPEARSSRLTALFASDVEMTVWWLSSIECRSALYRRHREKPIAPATLRASLRRLDAIMEDADSIVPTDSVRDIAHNLLSRHALLAADALQLAAALTWCESHPAKERFVCLDGTLRDAAVAQGFVVLPSE